MTTRSSACRAPRTPRPAVTMRLSAPGHGAAILASFVLLALIGFTDRVASACSLEFNPFVADPAEQAIDAQPPGKPTVSNVTVTRGRGPERSGCGATASSCDDIGSIRFSAAATDDRTPAELIGYRLTVTRGRAPAELFLGSGRDLRASGGTVSTSWGDGASDNQEDLDFDIEVRALDRAGNVSVDAAIVEVRSGGGGCRIAGGRLHSAEAAALSLLALIAATVSAARRRRDRA